MHASMKGEREDLGLQHSIDLMIALIPNALTLSLKIKFHPSIR